MPPVNIWAVLLATLSTMVVGSIWYTPKVFGNRWMKLTGVEPGETADAVGPIIITVVVSFITSYALAMLATLAHEFNGGSYLGNTLLVGLIAWAGFTAARFITHDAFEGRPTPLTTLNIGNELVTLLVMALIIGAFGSPA